jgi:hypothetical protein
MAPVGSAEEFRELAQRFWAPEVRFSSHAMFHSVTDYGAQKADQQGWGACNWDMGAMQYWGGSEVCCFFHSPVVLGVKG